MSTNSYNVGFNNGLALGIVGTALGVAIAGQILGIVSPQNHSTVPESHPTSVQSYSTPSEAAPKVPTVDAYSVHSAASIPGAIPGTDNPFDVPCKDESQNGCYWDATKFGNGIGQSYVVTNDGQVYYLDKEMSN